MTLLKHDPPVQRPWAETMPGLFVCGDIDTSIKLGTGLHVDSLQPGALVHRLFK
jgi:hypothetical protein